MGVLLRDGWGAAFLPGDQNKEEKWRQGRSSYKIMAATVFVDRGEECKKVEESEEGRRWSYKTH